VWQKSAAAGLLTKGSQHGADPKFRRDCGRARSAVFPAIKRALKVEERTQIVMA
jgi:hypothetical protein